MFKKKFVEFYSIIPKELNRRELFTFEDLKKDEFYKLFQEIYLSFSVCIKKLEKIRCLMDILEKRQSKQNPKISVDFSDVDLKLIELEPMYSFVFENIDKLDSMFWDMLIKNFTVEKLEKCNKKLSQNKKNV